LHRATEVIVHFWIHNKDLITLNSKEEKRIRKEWE